jgi:hypothetical protein
MGFACRFRPTYPDFLHGVPPTSACAAFIKESRMKFANASKLHRKSGVRSGRTWAPVQGTRLAVGRPKSLASLQKLPALKPRSINEYLCDALR